MAITRSFNPNTNILIDIAKSSLENSENSPHDSLITIMFSSAALEVFINESYEIVHYLKGNHEDLIKYAEMMKRMVKNRKSIECKYHSALLHLTGSSEHKGKQPYQNFKVLVSIRNFVLHNKPDTYVTQHQIKYSPKSRGKDEHPKFVQHLVAAKVIKTNDFNCNSIDLLLRKSVALWAFTTVEAMIENLILSTPNTEFQEKLWGVAYHGC
ncbi:hypothetical protein [Marinobacter sp. SS13-12]|uniref:hypothetical protein n=1 Tax=Marinobacter sp. SS13-12 TaxID=3050451 RepID=UPI00255661A2|nr:hypothetical protein [Marinobacter sp. SS13-12]MDK8465898.1 hypothetical protein [Marinobacter sp. SS13-12]